MKKNKNYFYFKILIAILIQITSIALFKHPLLILNILGFILFGLIQAHAIQLIHQCLHYKGFKSKFLNESVGMYLSIPVLISFKDYRKQHILHHKNLGKVEDKEFFGFDNIKPGKSIVQIFPYIFGLQKIQNLKKYPLLIVQIFLIIISLIKTDNYDVIVLWISSLVLVTEPIHFLIELPEHFGCKKESSGMYDTTRSFHNVPFLFEWFTNWNNYHSEHHAHQSVLPEYLHRFYDDKKSKKSSCHFESYLEFYSYFYKKIQREKLWK